MDILPKRVLISLSFVLVLIASSMAFATTHVNAQSATTLTAKFTPVIISSGETSTLQIIVGDLPTGLSGYKITVTLDNPNVARITDVTFPSWAVLYDIVEQTNSSVIVKAVDLQENINPGDSNVTLLTLTIEAISQGTTGVTIEINQMDDDNGDPITISEVYTNTLIVDPTKIGIRPEKNTVTIGSTVKVTIYADQLPKGLAGYKMRVRVNSTIARIVNVEFPSWATLYEINNETNLSIVLKAVDLYEQVQNGSTNVTLAIIYIEGVSEGEFKIELEVDQMDDDQGDTIPILIDESFNTVFTVTILQPLPGCNNPPQDPDGDGLYEDVNGNNRLDFDDVVVLFKNMDWIIEKGYKNYFDFNNNERMDFNDIVLLFKMI